MPDLPTTVAAGDPDHAGIHNAERAEINNRIAESQKGAAGGVAALGADGKVPAAQLPAAAAPPDATTTAKGIVQLAGDLGGTAAAPTVPGLAGKANDADVVHKTGAETIGGVKTFSSAPVVPDSSFTVAKLSATGTRDTTTFLRGDGTFSAPAGGSTADATATTKGVVQLAGDLSGTAAAPTVPALADYVPLTQKGAASGVATLGADGLVPAAQLPASSGGLAFGFIYYSWDGAAYVTTQDDDTTSPRWYDGPSANDPRTQAGHVARVGDKWFKTS